MDGFIIRKVIDKMRADLKEALMIIASETMPFEVMKKLSVEEFLIKYKFIINELEVKKEANGSRNRKNSS